MRDGVCLMGPGGSGGIQTYAGMIADRLSADWPGREAILIDTRGPTASASPLWTARALARLTWLAVAGRVGAAHLMASERMSLWRKAALALAARALGLRVILHHHGADLVGWGRAAGPGGRLALRLAAHAAHVNVVLGRDWARFLEDEVAVPPARVEILFNALADAGPPPRRARAPGAPLRVLFLAVMTPRKGARTLLDALALLRARGVDFEAVLAGDGPDRCASLAHAAALGLTAPSVRFPGAVDAAEAARLMGWADVLAHPSAREGLPMTLLEAMRAGLPAVAAPVGAIAEAMPDGDGLRHVPPHDAEALAAALRTLASDPAAREALGAAGRRAFLARFRLAVHADRLAALYGWTAPARTETEARHGPALT